MFVGVHEPLVQLKPVGHDTHKLPRAPQAVGAEPLTHWPFAQQPFAHVVALHWAGGGEHDVDTEADAPISAPRPNTRKVESFIMVTPLRFLTVVDQTAAGLPQVRPPEVTKQ